jgi:hypothetical protein
MPVERTQDCRDALMIAMSEGVELLLAVCAPQTVTPAMYMKLSELSGRIKGCREILSDAVKSN